MKIRLAKSEDFPELIDLQTRSLTQLSKPHYSSLESVMIADHQAQARQQANETRFVAEVQGQIVGFAALLNMQPMIGAIYVDPEWIRQGVGSKLLEAVEAEAKERHIRVLSVMSSLMAVPFYESQGYAVVNSHRFESQLGIWITCKYLRKHLVPQESFAQWVQHHWIVLSLSILFLMLGFVSSRPWKPQSSERNEMQNLLEMPQKEF
jgi:GNAT superfamily N-acetyltransferase